MEPKLVAGGAKVHDTVAQAEWSKKKLPHPGPERRLVQGAIRSKKSDEIIVKQNGGRLRKINRDDIQKMNPPKFDKVKDMAKLSVFRNLVSRCYSGLICGTAGSYWRQALALYVFLCIISSGLSVEVKLNGTINDGDIVCPGQVIIFTCETIGTEALAWFSVDYIGEGSRRLEFRTFDTLNLSRMGAVPGTVAVLIKNTTVNGTINVLISQLTIRVSDSDVFSSQNVICLHVRDNMRQTINFRSFAKPEIQQRILVEQRRDTIAMNTCMLSLTWHSPVNEYLSAYIINIDGENIVNKTDNLNASLNSFALLLYCGNYSVSLQAFDICGRVSNSTPVITVTPEEFPFSLITPDPIGPGGSPECSKSTSPDTLPIILGVSLGVVVIIGIIIVIVLALALWRTCSKYKKLNQQKLNTKLGLNKTKE